MRITKLKTNPETYSSNAWLVRGNFNNLSDINTLIDTGADDYIIQEIEKINTGVGKQRIEQIIITHNHFDHTGGIKSLKEKYKVIVYGYSKSKYVDKILKDGESIKIGDQMCQILHCPDHSNDSICIICNNEKLIFTGDINFSFQNKNIIYSEKLKTTIKYMKRNNIEKIYPGHGNILTMPIC